MIAWFDCFAGIAGDMTVAALVHAGAPIEDVLAEVRKLGVGGWDARAERVRRGAFAATRLVVDVADAHDHGHDHGHAHGHHAWREIRRLLEGSALRPRVKDRATRVFALLAEAEGRVHGVPPDEVTFHEVGAVDSIVDTVGACAALEALGIDRIVCSPLPMGRGSARMAHGVVSLPAPATLEVLRGFPVAPTAFEGELVTPTGAALMAALATPGPLPAMRIAAIGYGAGTRDPASHANVLRVVVGEGDAGGLAEVVELRAQVDDLTGESVPGLVEALFDAGAVDAYVTPITMKKGRPGLLVTALATPDARALVGEALLRHAGTLGYRWQVLPREVAARRIVEVATAFGVVRVKVAEREGRVLHAAPEHEDCAALARQFGVAVAEVRGAALAAWASKRDGASG
ncbi:MAG: nickel pincer cofactor biosynthesis protein LarC [Myxococcota bacterium]